MPIDKVSSYTVQALPELKETIPVQQFPPKAITGRDVVLINPFCEGGGDHALANKLANIALEEGCRVTIVPVGTREYSDVNMCHRNIFTNNKEHNIVDLHQPLFIVAPVDILDIENLEENLETICNKYNFKKQDIVLIEEMDRTPSGLNSLKKCAAMLGKMGFSDVTVCKLGFEQGSIGYLPVDKVSEKKIKDRFESELTVLLDSYNLTLDKISRYHLAYISCDCLCAAPVFLANTLSAIRNEPGDDNYIMVTRSLKESEKEPLKEKIISLLGIKNKRYNYPELFSKVSLSFADPETGKIKPALEIKGEGRRKVQVVFVKMLPENIFQDFICLSHSGMASGDQSLGEFLSLTGQLPYYDRQPWKAPMGRAFESMAEDFGGADLQQEVTQMIVGPSLYSKGYDYVLAANHNQPAPSPELKASMAALNRHVSAQTADSHIRALLKAAQAQHPATERAPFPPFAQGASPSPSPSPSASASASASGLEKFN